MTAGFARSSLMQSNADLIRPRLERWMETRVLEPSDYAESFVWDMSTFGGWPEQQEYVGPAGVQEFMDNWIATWNDWAFEIEEIREAAGGRVFVVATQRGVQKTAGVPVEMRLAQVWDFDEHQRATYVRVYSNVEDALAEAGLGAA